jgi:hypothetical protein
VSEQLLNKHEVLSLTPQHCKKNLNTLFIYTEYTCKGLIEKNIVNSRLVYKRNPNTQEAKARGLPV